MQSVKNDNSKNSIYSSDSSKNDSTEDSLISVVFPRQKNDESTDQKINEEVVSKGFQEISKKNESDQE